MKKIISFLAAVSLLFLCFSCSKGKNETQSDNSLNKTSKQNKDMVLNVASYSSFAEDWGAGGDIIKQFQRETGITVNLINAGSGAELVGYIKNNAQKEKVDVVVGISDDYINTDFASFLREPVVFDYSYYTFLKSRESKIKTPDSLWDLTKDEYNKQFILIDPRTSSVGLGALYWTKSVLKNDFINWWEKALKNALTVASSWSEAYGLFLNGEAPIVLSYTTSPWYDIASGEEPYAEALDFKEGHIKCEEYMAVLKSSENSENAQKFIDFMLSSYAQKKLSDINVMYPVVRNDELQSIFTHIKEPKTVVEKDSTESGALIDYWQERIL